jgi:hypothetical protein
VRIPPHTPPFPHAYWRLRHRSSQRTNAYKGLRDALNKKSARRPHVPHSKTALRLNASKTPVINNLGISASVVNLVGATLLELCFAQKLLVLKIEAQKSVPHHLPPTWALHPKVHAINVAFPLRGYTTPSGAVQLHGLLLRALPNATRTLNFSKLI